MFVIESVIFVFSLEYVETIVTRQYLALYPVEPGIFLVYFIRSEDDFINLRSLLAVYQAIFSCTETGSVSYSTR